MRADTIVLLNSNKTFIAHFEEQNTTPRYNVNLSASPANSGAVTGAGGYDSGSVVIVFATANSNYTFRN
jgi:hypothetical protein